MSFEIKKIHDPKFFKENCMAAHSDHVAYADETEAEEKKSSFRLLLDGSWKFHDARTYTQTVNGFEAETFDCKLMLHNRLNLMLDKNISILQVI